MTPRTTYCIILAGAFLWAGLIVLAPYLAASSSPFAAFVYQAFGSICHQLPERSFHLFGAKLAVCSRCTAIYFAFVVGVIAYPFFIPSLQHSATPSRGVLLAALLAMVAEVALEFFGFHESTFLTRAITGGIFGGVVPFFVLPAAIEAVQQLSASQRRVTINEPT
jgi:uncharacterized membrane protein